MDQLEAGTAARLSAAPVRMTIPLAQMTLVKAIAEKYVARDPDQSV